MFSTSTTPMNGGGDKEGEDDNDGGGAGGHGDGEMSHPWGAAGGSSGNPKGEQGGGANWQSSSSLSWLTNLRKGIMSGGELKRTLFSTAVFPFFTPFPYNVVFCVACWNCCYTFELYFFSVSLIFYQAVSLVFL